MRVALAALAVLALTATIVFAGREDAPPPAADHGLDTATEASGHDVPVRANEEEDLEPEAEPEAEPEIDPAVEVEEELEVAPAVEGGEHCVPPDAEGAEPLVDGEEANHGAIVCGAARFGDWEAAGCENHGQYVRTFANKNFDGEAGDCESSEATGGEVTAEIVEEPETAAAAGNGNGRGNSQPGGNGNGNNGQGRGNNKP
jgi:hypothetical protein